jgi:hypothetical protein
MRSKVSGKCSSVIYASRVVFLTGELGVVDRTCKSSGMDVKTNTASGGIASGKVTIWKNKEMGV